MLQKSHNVTPKTWTHCTREISAPYAYSSTLHSGQHMESERESIISCTECYRVTKKEWISIIYIRMVETGGHHIEWNKLDTIRQTLHFFLREAKSKRKNIRKACVVSALLKIHRFINLFFFKSWPNKLLKIMDCYSLMILWLF